jgi:hypothetical protein
MNNSYPDYMELEMKWTGYRLPNRKKNREINSNKKGEGRFSFTFIRREISPAHKEVAEPLS